MADLNSLAQSAQSLIDQLNNGNITFESFKNSVNSITSSAQGLDTANDDLALYIHTIHEAQSIAAGETVITRK
jgi:hypothetical protein